MGYGHDVDRRGWLPRSGPGDHRQALRLVAIGLIVTATAALIGCSPGADPTPTTGTKGPALLPESTTSTSMTTTPTTVASTTDPEIPPAAREESLAGAEAFVRHFFESMNRAYISSSSRTLRSLVAPECPACTAIIADIDDQAARGLHAAGDVAKVKSVVAVNPVPGMAKVEAHTDQLPVAILDASGRTTALNPATPSNLLFTLSWSSGWVVTRLQVIS